jgi:ABC-type multidrug transport system permease subunit
VARAFASCCGGIRARATSRSPAPASVSSGFLHDVGQFLPWYWLVQAARISIHGHAWGVMGWAVVLGWTIVLVVFATWAYMRDTGRV